MLASRLAVSLVSESYWQYRTFIPLMVPGSQWQVGLSLAQRLFLGSMIAGILTISAAQVGAERFNLFKGCPKARTATMVLRGGSEQFIDEAERSLHDAIMIVRRAIKNASVVAGGGAIDMEISRCCTCPLLSCLAVGSILLTA